MGNTDQYIAQFIAQEELDQFFNLPFLREQDRIAYHHFVRHAAFPLVLTTDLLYNIWLNFGENSAGETIDCPREVVSDLLLSGLCKKVGKRSWEFTAGVREILLKELLQTPNFGTKRMRELADFTLLYAGERLDPKNALDRTIAEVLRWGALAYIRPDEAAERMALALAQTLESKDGAGQLRMHHMLEKLAGPMSRYASFRDLRRFAAGVARNVAGQGQAAQTDFANMNQNALEIGNVILNAPAVQKAEPPICFFGYITSPPSQTRSMTVLDFDDEHRRIVPYFRRLEEKGLIQIIVQYDMRPVEIENILTDPSFKNRIAFLHLSGHASTLEEQSQQQQQQQQVQSNIPPPAFGGFNPDGKLVNWRSLVKIFQRYPELNLITLDDVLTSNQLEALRSDARNRLNKVFNPFLPEGLRNMMVIDHTITNADLMPYLLGFYDKFTRNTSVNNAINEASDEHLGQLNQLKNTPVVTWLTNGWWKLSDHPILTPELFDFEEKKVLSIEDAAIVANIGDIYRQGERVGFGILVDDFEFVTSFYYLEGSEHIRFYRNGRWHEYVYEKEVLIRTEQMNVAKVHNLAPEPGSLPLSDFSIKTLPSEFMSNMAGFSWEMDLYYPVIDENGDPVELKRISVETSVDRFDLRYSIEDWDHLSGIPLIRSNGRVGGFHFGQMSDNPTEKVGVWWPGVKEELERKQSQKPEDRIRELETKLRTDGDDLETLNELARAYRLSPDHDPEQAVEFLERALKIDDQNTFSLNEMGMNFRARQMHEEALSYFNTVLEIDPQNTFALNEVGLTYADLKEMDLAESFFRRTIEIDSANQFALRELSNIYELSGDIPKAIAFTDRLLLLDPKNELVRNQLNKLQSEWAARQETFGNIREHIQRGDLDLAFKVFEDLGTIPEDIRIRVRALSARHKQITRPKKRGSFGKQSPADQLNEIAEELMGILDDLTINVAQTQPDLDEPELNPEQRIEELEDELKTLIEDDPRNLSYLAEINIHLTALLEKDPENKEWKRRYGRNLERIGDFHADLKDWEAAEKAYRLELEFFSQELSKYPGADWLLMATGIANEKVADTLREQNNPGDLAQYETALRLFQQLEGTKNGYKGLNKALGIIYRKLSEVAEEEEDLQQTAQEYRIKSKKYFARATKPISEEEMEKILQNEDLSDAINKFQSFLYQKESDPSILAKVQELEDQLNAILLRPSPPTESTTGMDIMESITQFNQRSIRIDLQNIYQEVVPPTGTLTGEYPGLLHRELFREVLNYGTELVDRNEIDGTLQLLQDFKASFTPGRQDKMESIQNNRNNQGSGSRSWTSAQSQEILRALREIITEEQALFATASSTTGNGEPDRQEILGQLMGRLEKDNVSTLLKGMPQLSSFLEGAERTQWEVLINQLTELEENETRWSRDPRNYSKRIDELKASILEFLTGKRDEWFPIS